MEYQFSLPDDTSDDVIFQNAFQGDNIIPCMVKTTGGWRGMTLEKLSIPEIVMGGRFCKIYNQLSVSK